MISLRNISIQRKMTLVTLVTCGVTLLVATGAFFSYQLLSFRQTFRRDLSVTAQMIANNSAAPLTFKDQRAAEEVLAALKVKPHIRSAWIELPQGAVFARFTTMLKEDDPQEMPGTGARFAGNYLLQDQPIMLDKERLGTLYLQADYRTVFRALLRFYIGMLVVVLGVSIVLAFALSARLHRFISGPILKLAAGARLVAEKKDYTVRVLKTANDELGLFTDTFNLMLAQIQAQDTRLQEAQQGLAKQVEALQHEISERKNAESKLSAMHKQLLEISRCAGMAEVATGVLHNVGNVLNSVNVSVSLMQEHARRSKVENLAKLVGLLDEHSTDLAAFLNHDPKGQRIPKYLRQLSEHLTRERQTILEEMKAVARNVEHIKEIVAMQQSYARVAGVRETLSAAVLVEEALQINASTLERHGVTLERQFSDVPAVTVDKHKVLQILINLIGNAKHAMDESGKSQKVLRLGIAPSGEDRIRISVADNGVGIPPENLTRIFAHGFTTKKNGHGFGLHSGALAAREMSGCLTAHSEGLGHGATFTLELPVSDEGPAQG
jgi:two-component system NtrC family sensor kinase